MALPTPSLQALGQYFKHGFALLGVQEEAALAERFTERRVKRREVLLPAGAVCRHVYFVVVGCLRLYAVDASGKEHNLLFAVENEWLTDLASLFGEQPSQVTITALEPTTVLQVGREELLSLFTNHHKFDRNFRLIVERAYVALQDRLLQSISTPAEERYQTFLRQYPQWARRLPNAQIATYLGITPEFLSRVRRDLAGRGRTAHFLR